MPFALAPNAILYGMSSLLPWPVTTVTSVPGSIHWGTESEFEGLLFQKFYNILQHINNMKKITKSFGQILPTSTNVQSSCSNVWMNGAILDQSLVAAQERSGWPANLLLGCFLLNIRIFRKSPKFQYAGIMEKATETESFIPSFNQSVG
jgi:hypothetical protein